MNLNVMLFFRSYQLLSHLLRLYKAEFWMRNQSSWFPGCKEWTKDIAIRIEDLSRDSNGIIHEYQVHSHEIKLNYIFRAINGCVICMLNSLFKLK
jgi:hypothetical protein